jgi:reductive dehalogenase
MILAVFGIFLFLFFLWVAFISLREDEKRAAGVSLLLGLVAAAFFLLPALLSPGTLGYTVLSGFLAGMVIAGAVLFFLPPPIRKGVTDSIPSGRIDERDIMFSRRLLEPGTKRYEDYYRQHPEKKSPDDRFREKPGLLSRKARYYDPFTFPAAEAYFQTIEYLAAGIDGPPASQKTDIEPARITRYLKDMVSMMGVVDSGVAVMQPYHYYHTGGRDHNYGEPVVPRHRYGFVFTVEMDRTMINTGPRGPAVMESARQYLEAARIAVAVAQYLRELGYEARAHIDAHYEVVCPLVARDAGLGEIGRMGLLMTPRLGPRVRIGVVTTNMELLPDGRKDDPAMTDFCYRCKKCAVNCPAQAIPHDPPALINGVRRWQINQEACYTYWTITGTDCGRCVAVCPFSHPDNLFHRFVRWGIKHSFLINRLSLPVDELFYGKKPPAGPIPRWLRTKKNESL